MRRARFSAVSDTNPRANNGVRLSRFAQAYVRFAAKKPLLLLLAVLLLSVLAALSATRIAVNPRLEALLPADSVATSSVKELRSRVKSATPLYLLIQSSEPELNRRLIRKLHKAILQWPETRWAMFRRDADYFLDHRLLYLSADDIQELGEQIGERHRWEECARLPGCSNLDDEAPPLPTEEDLQTLFEKDPDVRSLLSLFGSNAEAFAKTESEVQARDPAASGQEAQVGDLCSEDGQICTLQVSIDGDAGDIDFATEILTRSEALFEMLRPSDAPADIKFAVSGPYRNLPVTKRQVSADLTRTTLLSALLVLFVILLQFRGKRSVLALFLPTVLGILWTGGLVGAIHPELNLLSAFTLAVLAGIGIDFGVHLLTFYADQRETHSTEQAAARALTHLLPSLAIAAFTTSCGFAALYAGSFRGFSEMGPVAALGIVCTAVLSVFLFPPLMLVLDRGESCPFALRRYGGGRAWFSFAPHAKTIAVVGTLLLLGLTYLGQNVEFEYNTRKLRPPGVSHGIPWGKTMHGTQRNEVFLLADDAASLERFAELVRNDVPHDIVHTERPFVLLPSGFIPDNQTERLQAVADLRTTLTTVRASAKAELADKIDGFLPLTAVDTPISAQRMPSWVKDWLFEKDGRFGTLGILYTDLSGADARQMAILAQKLEHWREQFPELRFASPVAQLGEVVPRLKSDAPYIVCWALLGVILGTLLGGRSVRRTALVLVPLLLSVSGVLGLMVIFGLKANLYNAIVFPLAFGIGVDGAVYITWALTSKSPEAVFPVAARAVVGSALTTLVAFGALTVSVNPGLRSIGMLAVAALLLSLLSDVVWLPALARSLRRTR